MLKTVLKLILVYGFRCFLGLELFLVVLFQGLEGCSRDPGFDQNMVRDSGKRKIS